MNKFITYFLIIVISFGLGFFYSKPNKSPDVVTKTIPGDSVFIVKTDTIIKPSYIHKVSIDSVFDTIYRNTIIDTLALLQDYFNIKVYEDTIIDDSSMTVIIQDSISRNKIIGRTSFLKNNRETSIINNYTYSNEGLYGGITLSKHFININASYSYKRSNFELGINFITLENNSKIVPSIGYKYLILKR